MKLEHHILAHRATKSNPPKVKELKVRLGIPSSNFL